MIKADIADRIHSNIGLTKKDSQVLLESVLSIMKETLESGEDVKISSFGKFEVKQKNARKGRNPQSSETIIIEARKVTTFKPSTTLKNIINIAT